MMNIIKERRTCNFLRDKNSPEYSNWRGNVTEGYEY